MIAFDQLMLAKFNIEEYEEYGLFDEYGSLVGTREDAPDEFKMAYEHDMKMRDEALKKGIIL